jgi:hypothetical protein
MKKKTIQQQEIFLLVYDPVSRCTTFTRIYTLTTANELQNDTVHTFYLPTNRYIFKDETANQIQSSRQINDAETEKDIHLPPSRPIDDAALSLYNPQKWNNDISQQSEFFGFESEECWNEGTPIEQPIPDNYNKPQLEQSAPNIRSDYELQKDQSTSVTCTKFMYGNVSTSAALSMNTKRG